MRSASRATRSGPTRLGRRYEMPEASLWVVPFRRRATMIHALRRCYHSVCCRRPSRLPRGLKRPLRASSVREGWPPAIAIQAISARVVGLMVRRVVVGGAAALEAQVALSPSQPVKSSSCRRQGSGPCSKECLSRSATSCQRCSSRGGELACPALRHRSCSSRWTRARKAVPQPAPSMPYHPSLPPLPLALLLGFERDS
jgi:hypothetical protein